MPIFPTGVKLKGDREKSREIEGKEEIRSKAGKGRSWKLWPTAVEDKRERGKK